MPFYAGISRTVFQMRWIWKRRPEMTSTAAYLAHRWGTCQDQGGFQRKKAISPHRRRRTSQRFDHGAIPTRGNHPTPQAFGPNASHRIRPEPKRLHDRNRLHIVDQPTIAKKGPRSQSMTWGFSQLRTFSTTYCMSFGAMNCPFLIL